MPPTATRPPRKLRRFQSAIDVAVAVVATALNVGALWTSLPTPMGHTPPSVWAVLLATGSTLPAAYRRRYPTCVALLVGASYFTAVNLSYPSFAGGIIVLLVTYTLGAHARFGRGLVLCSLFAVGGLAYLVVHQARLDTMGLGLNVMSVLIQLGQFYAAWLIGRLSGARRSYLQQLEDRASQLERANAAEVRAALAEERARVARELHDVVAHHVSVMTVQSAAAQRAMQRAPEQSQDAMQTVEATGRSALSEMRRIVGALRTHDEEAELDLPDRSPQVGVDNLGSLIDRYRNAGMDVHLTVVGTTRPLPNSVDVAVYRVVQEALTNTLRHSPGFTAEITVTYGAKELVVQAVDRGTPRSVTTTESPVNGHTVHTRTTGTTGVSGATGHGLVGMRERVALNGGTLWTGHGVNGFRVEARLPLEEVG